MSGELFWEIHRRQDQERARELALSQAMHRCPGCIVPRRSVVAAMVGRWWRPAGSAPDVTCCAG